MDEVFSDCSRSTGDAFIVDLEEFCSVISGRVVPFITPELSKDLVDFDGVTCDDIITVFDCGNSFLVGRERATNGS